MESLRKGYRAEGASGFVAGPQGAARAGRRQGAPAWPCPSSRDPSRLDRLYRLKLAGRDPERRKRRRRSLQELACWFALALLVAAALVSPVRAATMTAADAVVVANR